MKYKSNITKPIKLSILLLLLFWVVNFIAIISSNGYKDAIVFSMFMLVFMIIFISAFVKGTYIVLKDKKVEYVHMFALRKLIEISKITKIQKGMVSGFYTSLSLVYEDGGKLKDIKIITLTFKNDTLRQFVSDLKNQNSNLDVDSSVNELLTNKL
jgi:hypothetical protein